MATVEELQAKLDEAETKNKQLDERAKRFEGQLVDVQKQLEKFSGVDLEALKAAKDENEILKRKTDGFDEAKFQEAVAAGIQKEREDWQKKITKLEDDNRSLFSQVNEYEVVGKSMEHLAPKVKDDTAPFIKEILRKSLRKEGDKLLVYNGDEKVYSKKDVSQQMEASEYYGIIQEQYPSMFKGEIPAGTMNKGERVNGASNIGADVVSRLQNPEMAATLSVEEKAKAGLEIARKFRQF